jgi:hypothetical protein
MPLALGGEQCRVARACIGRQGAARVDVGVRPGLWRRAGIVVRLGWSGRVVVAMGGSGQVAG